MNLQRLHCLIQVTEVLSNSASNTMARVTGLHIDFMLVMITLCTWQIQLQSLSRDITRDNTGSIVKAKVEGKKRKKERNLLLSSSSELVI